MTLDVKNTPDSLTATVATFMVPGHQRWTLRSVCAHAHRGVGGLPNRAFELTITDGTTTVAQVGAGDAGTEPGTCSVTWADIPPSSSASGGTGIVVAPIGPLLLDPGYVLTLTILNPAGADKWNDAAVWFDFVDTGL